MRSPVTPLLPWQILFLCAVCGILALRVPLPAVAALGMGLLFARACGVARLTLTLAPLAFLAGLCVAWLALPGPPARVPREVLAGTRTVVTGTVAAAAPRPGDRLTLVLDDVRLARPAPADEKASRDAAPRPIRLPGRLQLSWDHPSWRPETGDVLALSTVVRPVVGFRNPGGYDAVFARQLEGVFFRASARGDAPVLLTASGAPWSGLRQGARRDILAAVSPPESPPESAPEGGPPPAQAAAPSPGGAMLLALLTGDTSAMTIADMDVVRRASLAHVLALSGMHVGYVAAMGWLLAWLVGKIRPGVFLRLPRHKLAVLLAAPLVAVYVWLGGATPSLVRAALMFACFGAMIFRDRPRVLLDGLFFALLCIVAVSPLAVFDVRLRMSALAVAGIAVFWAPGMALFRRLPLPEGLRPAALWVFGLLWVSVSAQIALLPVLALEFGEMSPHVWLNLIWLPVLGCVVMPLGLAGLVASLIGPQAAAVCYVPAAFACGLLMDLLAVLDGLGWLGTLVVLRPLWPESLGYFTLVVAAAAWWPGRPLRPLVAATLLAGFVLLAGPALRQTGRDLSGQVRLTMLDVGQGQALVAELPGGRRILVDGGGLGSGDFDLGRAVTGPALTYGRAPKLAGMILTHAHADHAQGLAWPLARFDVGFFAQSASPDAGEPDAALSGALAASGLAPRSLAAGDRLDLGDGVVLEALHPPADFAGTINNASLVLRLVKDGRGLAVLCGDVEKKSLRALLESGADLTAEVLVVPHHGSASSLSRAFYKAVAPRAAFISCGPGNRYRYPSDKVLADLSRLGCPVYVTAAQGAIQAIWSGDAPAEIDTVAGIAPRPVSRP